MRKPTLLYASPLPSQRTGIAIYSRWLIEALAEFFEITLYTDCTDISDPYLAQFRVLQHGRDRVDFEAFDYRLYQIGNNPWFHGYIYEACLLYPGWILLHEFVLYFLVIGLYRHRPDFYRRIFRIGRAPAIAALRSMARSGIDPFQFGKPETVPLSAELSRSANQILVHSDYTRSLVLQVAPQARVYKVEYAQPTDAVPPSIRREECLTRWGMPPDAILVCSFGFVAPTKLNHVVCRAVERVSERRRAPIYYVMVGEGNYVTCTSDRIQITGFVSEAEFDEYLAASDLVINLRYPVMGETSAALLRALAFRKPCIVTDAGWFSELPDSVVLKLDVSNPGLIEEYVFEALDIFLDSRQPFQKMAEAANIYVHQRHSPAAVARRYFELMTSAQVEPQLVTS